MPYISGIDEWLSIELYDLWVYLVRKEIAREKSGQIDKEDVTK